MFYLLHNQTSLKKVSIDLEQFAFGFWINEYLNHFKVQGHVWFFNFFSIYFGSWEQESTCVQQRRFLNRTHPVVPWHKPQTLHQFSTLHPLRIIMLNSNNYSVGRVSPTLVLWWLLSRQKSWDNKPKTGRFYSCVHQYFPFFLPPSFSYHFLSFFPSRPVAPSPAVSSLPLAASEEELFFSIVLRWRNIFLSVQLL